MSAGTGLGMLDELFEAAGDVAAETDAYRGRAEAEYKAEVEKEVRAKLKREAEAKAKKRREEEARRKRAAERRSGGGGKAASDDDAADDEEEEEQDGLMWSNLVSEYGELAEYVLWVTALVAAGLIGLDVLGPVLGGLVSGLLS